MAWCTNVPNMGPVGHGLGFGGHDLSGFGWKQCKTVHGISCVIGDSRWQFTIPSLSLFMASRSHRKVQCKGVANFWYFWFSYAFWKFWSDLSWPEDGESPWGFGIDPVGDLCFPCDVVSHKQQLHQRRKGILVLALQKKPLIITVMMKHHACLQALLQTEG